jgi:hypothetical protein
VLPVDLRFLTRPGPDLRVLVPSSSECSRSFLVGSRGSRGVARRSYRPLHGRIPTRTLAAPLLDGLLERHSLVTKVECLPVQNSSCPEAHANEDARATQVISGGSSSGVLMASDFRVPKAVSGIQGHGWLFGTCGWPAT